MSSKQTSALAVGAGNGALRWLGKRYQAGVGAKLREYGLKYEDVLIEQDPDITAALARLPPHEAEARKRRIQRALDLSFKKKALSPEIQGLQGDPYHDQVRTIALECEEERLEREELLDLTPPGWEKPIIMGGALGLATVYLVWMGMKPPM